MGPYEFYQHAAERIRDVDNQPVLVAAEIEDCPIVADKIDGLAKLTLDVVQALPPRLGRDGVLDADRSFGLLSSRVGRVRLFLIPGIVAAERAFLRELGLGAAAGGLRARRVLAAAGPTDCRRFGGVLGARFGAEFVRRLAPFVPCGFSSP
jgi:hypothetical protein